MLHQIIKLTLAIAVIVLLGACAAKIVKTTNQDIKASVKTIVLKTGHSGALHSNLRMTLLKAPEGQVYFTQVPFGRRDFLQKPLAAGYYAAAQAVFSRIGSISGETTFSPHLIARIKKVSCHDGPFGTSCMASMDLYWGTGEFIRTYEAHNSLSGWYYNCYVKIFESIVKQMLSDKSLAPYFDHGFDDSPASVLALDLA